MYSPCKKGDLNKLMSLNEEILRRPNRSEYLLGIMDNYESFRNVATSMVDDSEMINATLPPNLMFINQSLTAIVIYCLCFVVSAIGNLTVFITLTCDRYRKSRISFRSRILICHLSVADLLVTFIMIPVEVGWRLTIQWVAGNFACKIFAFLRAFGLYLSSNILVCVSVDRYFAVVHPLRFKDARRRGKLMLILAWTCSAVFAIPQCFVFHVLSHPNYPDFKQCVTFDSGINNTAYTIFCVLAMYFIPLVIICWAYINILHEITNQSRDSSGQSEQTLVLQSSSNGTLGPSTKTNDGNRMRLRRSDMANIERARIRTLRMTITIVVVFIVCWTPYVIMVLWYMIHDESAVEVDPRLQDTLFLMAVGNSCANPLVYGSYAVNLREVCFRCCLPYNNNNDKSQIEVRIVQPSPVLDSCSRNIETLGEHSSMEQLKFTRSTITTDVSAKINKHRFCFLVVKKMSYLPSVIQELCQSAPASGSTVDKEEF